MSIRTRYLAGAGALALTLSLGSAIPASAGTPSPSPSTSYTTRPPVPVPVARSWTFDVQVSAFGPVVPTLVNRVDGVGAIPMDRWLNRDLSPNVSVFRSPINPLNSVTILHGSLPLPTVFLPTCTLTFDQVTPFRIIAGTGTGAGLRSRGGLIRLNGLISFPFVNIRHGQYGYGYGSRQVCPLQLFSIQRLRLLVLQHLIFNTPFPVAQPTLLDFNAQGFAPRVFRVTPVPYVTPSPTYSVPATVAPATVAPTSS